MEAGIMPDRRCRHTSSMSCFWMITVHSKPVFFQCTVKTVLLAKHHLFIYTECHLLFYCLVIFL